MRPGVATRRSRQDEAAARREHARLREKLKRNEREEERIRQNSECSLRHRHGHQEAQFVLKMFDIAECAELMLSTSQEGGIAEDRVQVCPISAIELLTVDIDE